MIGRVIRTAGLRLPPSDTHTTLIPGCRRVLHAPPLALRRQHTRTRIGPKRHFAPKQAICIRTTELSSAFWLISRNPRRHDLIDAELPVLDDAPEDQRRTLSRAYRRVGARSPGPCPSLSVTLAIGITSRPTFDPVPVGHAGAGRAICRRGSWSIASSTRGFTLRQGDTPYLISPYARVLNDQDEKGS